MIKRSSIILYFFPIFIFCNTLPDLKSEISIKNYFEKNGTEGIEGIWQFSSKNITLGSSNTQNRNRIAIIKKDNLYYGTMIDRDGVFQPGDLRATFELVEGKKKKLVKVDEKTEDVLVIVWNIDKSGSWFGKRKVLGFSKSKFMRYDSIDISEIYVDVIKPVTFNKIYPGIYSFSTFLTNLDTIKNNITEEYRLLLDDEKFERSLDDIRELNNIAIDKLSNLKKNLLNPWTVQNEHWVETSREVNDEAFLTYRASGLPIWLAKQYAEVSYGHYVETEYEKFCIINKENEDKFIKLRINPTKDDIIDYWGYLHLLAKKGEGMYKVNLYENEWNEHFGFTIDYSEIKFFPNPNDDGFLYDMDINFYFKDNETMIFWFEKFQKQIKDFDPSNISCSENNICIISYEGKVEEIILPEHYLEPTYSNVGSDINSTYVNLLLPEDLLNFLISFKKCDFITAAVSDKIDSIIKNNSITFPISRIEGKKFSFSEINKHYKLYLQEIKTLLIEKYNFIHFDPTFRIGL